MPAQSLSLLATGFLTGLGLIVVIGSQNAYLLRQGIRREHVGLVVLICALGDLVLIAAGTAGVGGVASRAPWVLEVLRWAGAVYLLWFATRSFLSAWRGGESLEESRPSGARSVLLTATTLTFLNPHVYLDTVLTLGTVINRFGDGKWFVAVGAMLASIAWFSSLGWGARALAPFLRSQRTWRIVDAGVGVVMLGVAALLLLG